MQSLIRFSVYIVLLGQRLSGVQYYPLCVLLSLRRYKFLRDFDRAMQNLDEKHSFMVQGRGHVSRKHDSDKLIVFERGGLLWIFNFHPTQVCVCGGGGGGGMHIVISTLHVYRT